MWTFITKAIGFLFGWLIALFRRKNAINRANKRNQIDDIVDRMPDDDVDDKLRDYTRK